MSRPAVLVHSFRVSRAVSAGLALFVLAVGALFLSAFWFGGLLDGWRIVLGLLPPAPVDEIVLAVVALFAGFFVVFPVWLFFRMVILGDKRRPRAFFFDNEARRFLISEESWTPGTDRQALSGYDYRELDSFGITTYTTTSTTNNRTTTTTHYVVGFSKTDGESWPLEEFLSPQRAQELLDRLEAEVALKDEPDHFPPKPPRLSSSVEEIQGSDLTFAWRGRVAFGTAFWFLFGAAALAWFSLKLYGRGFALEPVVVLFVFVGIIGLMGLFLVYSSLQRALRKNALRVSNQSLEIGTLSKAGVFRARKTWPLAEVRSVATVFTLELRRSKTRFLALKGRPSEDKKVKREQLDIAGLSLSEVVDLEHRLEQELNRRGAKAK